MTTYLDKILERTRADLKERKQAVPLAELKTRAARRPPTLDFTTALSAPGIHIIAEVKKASPSKGVMAAGLDPAVIARTYAANGAAAISVLTEEPHFQGKLEYLGAIKKALNHGGPPLLRKDFVLDPYQVYESRAHEADALLLIVSALADAELRDLLALAGEIGLHCLVEVHDEEEAGRAVKAGARVIGINNRDLRTFKVNLETTARVRPCIPPGRVVVSESGIATRADVLRLAGWGVNAALIGEALVTAPDAGARLRELQSP